MRRILPRMTDPVLAALFQHPRDLASLERMVLAWAVHPRGPAFDRARWLVWSPSRALLVGRLWWGAAPATDDPADTLIPA
ncbi:MAG: hypothetical protein ACRENJ_12545, partial [Candidatus Eiseniibacteriota bacterium]